MSDTFTMCYCKEKDCFCRNATVNGYCNFTACMKRHEDSRTNIIDDEYQRGYKNALRDLMENYSGDCDAYFSAGHDIDTHKWLIEYVKDKVTDE